MSEIRLGRRAFLSVVGLGAVGLLAGGRLSGAAAPLGRLVPDGVGNLVSAGGWRIYAISPPWPSFDPASWRLEVTGEVEQPVKLTYDQLLALPSQRQTSDFHCVTGWTVGDVRWQGVRLADAVGQGAAEADGQVRQLRLDGAAVRRHADDGADDAAAT